MNEIKSHEWQLLSSLIKKPNGTNILLAVVDFLSKETEKYEKGEAYYPKIEFAISIIQDDEKWKNIDTDTKDTKPKPKIPEPEPEPEPVLDSPNTRRQKIRDSWIIKYSLSNKEVTPIVPEPVVSIPVKTTVKRVIRRKVIKEQEPEPESASEPKEPEPKPKPRGRPKKIIL